MSSNAAEADAEEEQRRGARRGEQQTANQHQQRNEALESAGFTHKPKAQGGSKTASR